MNDFAPSAIATWDWNINDKMKLTTSVFGKYSMYKSTKLNYANAENPQPDYWKNLPSSYYDIWNADALGNNSSTLQSWYNSYNYWTASKANRQIDCDRLYYANTQAANQGHDALYFIQAKHSDNLMFNMASTLSAKVTKRSTLVGGLVLGSNSNRHYQTMDDLLGASFFHNINTYALGTYPADDPRVQYDLNTAGPNNLGSLVYEGDKFGYDYKIEVMKGLLWTSYTAEMGDRKSVV